MFIVCLHVIVVSSEQQLYEWRVQITKIYYYKGGKINTYVCCSCTVYPLMNANMSHIVCYL